MMSKNCRRLSINKNPLIIVIMLIFMVITIFFPANAVSAADKTIIGKDILFIYDEDLSSKGKENVAAMADILTYMGYGTSYSTVNESIGMLNKFDSLLFYHESDNISSSFLKALEDTDIKIMMVGGGSINELLNSLKLDYTSIKVKDTTVKVSYEVGYGEASISLIKAENAIIFQEGFPYSAGYIEAAGKSSPLFVRDQRFSCMGAFDSDSDILKAAFSEQISIWKWPFENQPNSYPQYIIFDNVYPFFSSERLMKVVQLMDKKGVPYSITVMPVYQNTEYPAMKHFCEVLAYAQSKGASIIMKAPLINTDQPSLEDINKRITTAITAYNNYEVFPIAIEAPNNWIHESLGLDVLRRFSTVILYPEENNSWTDSDGYNTVYSDGHHLIAPAILGNSSLGSNMIKAYPTALFLDINSDMDILESQIKQIQQSEISLKSLWLTSHTVYTNDRVVSLRDGILTVNGKIQSIEFQPFSYEENFDFNRGVIGKMAESMARENRRLLLIVTFISIIFVFFIAVARYQNRRRFLYKRTSEQNLDGGDAD